MDQTPTVRQAAQNQHYVPKFILRNFLADSPKQRAHVFSKRTGKGFTTSIANIMAERRFHEFRIDESYIASFEESIGRIEDIVLPTCRRVVENQVLDGTPDERATLAALIALQFMRTRAQRDMYADLQKQMAERIAAMGADIDLVEALGPMDEQQQVAQHVQSIGRAIADFMPHIADKDFLLIQAPAGRSFYLSDNPVALHNDLPKDGIFGNLGFAVRGIQVYMPLSAELMLCAWCPSILGQMREKNAADKRELAAAMLSPGFIATPGFDLEANLRNLRVLRESIETRLRHANEGTPALLTEANMDFMNSLQVATAREHVVCKQADFALARQFMKENPGHRGGRRVSLA